MKIKTENLIISDIHLGSPLCQHNLLKYVLKKVKYKNLILAGDVIDHHNFGKFSQEDIEIMYLIGEKELKGKVNWIRGNHDAFVLDCISLAFGVEMRNSCTLERENYKILVMHGDEFDNIIIKKPLLTKFFCFLYYSIQKIGLYKFALWAKHKTKILLNMSEKVKNGAINKIIKNISNNKKNIVICGHTHLPLYYNEKNITYINTGSFTEPVSTFATVDENGDSFLFSISIENKKIKINQFEQ
jgi:UDP-2,3-diacylglucosamine pyrophosphatase LpxH